MSKTLRSRWLRLTLLLGTSAALLAYVLRDLDSQTALEAYAALDPKWIAACLALLTAQVLVRAARMQWLLEPTSRPRWWTQVSITAIGFMAITTLPLRIGEAVRPWLLAREGVTVAEGTGAVVAERAFDLLALIGLFIATTMFVDLPASSLEVQGIDIVSAATRSVSAIVVTAFVAIVALLLGGEHVARLIRRIPKVGPRAAEFVLRMRSSLRGLSRSPGRLAAVTGASITVWLITVAVAWAMLAAFPTTPATAALALTLATAVIAGTLVIPTPGFFGPFELAAQTVLLLWSVPRGQAASFAIAWHLLVFGFTFLAGVACAAAAGVSVRDAIAADDANQDATEATKS